MLIRSSTLQETENFFHEKIPITSAMGVRVESYDAQQLVIVAPLEANHNHLGTAFGGSLSAIATLAGYGLLWLCLGDRKAHIVVKSSSIQYRHPVRGEIRAICRRPSASELEQFKTKFEKSGKSGISLNVTIEESGRVCVDFQGIFVAIA